VRFASVYRQFEDVQAFHDEIERLRAGRPAKPPAHRQPPAHKRRGGHPASRDQLPLLPGEGTDEEPGSGGKQ